MTVKGGPSNSEIKLIPKHKKNADIGSKKTVYSSNIFIEQKDAISFDENEEVSCMEHSNGPVLIQSPRLL